MPRRKWDDGRVRRMVVYESLSRKWSGKVFCFFRIPGTEGTAQLKDVPLVSGIGLSFRGEVVEAENFSIERNEYHGTLKAVELVLKAPSHESDSEFCSSPWSCCECGQGLQKIETKRVWIRRPFQWKSWFPLWDETRRRLRPQVSEVWRSLDHFVPSNWNGKRRKSVLTWLSWEMSEVSANLMMTGSWSKTTMGKWVERDLG